MRIPVILEMIRRYSAAVIAMNRATWSYFFKPTLQAHSTTPQIDTIMNWKIVPKIKLSLGELTIHEVWHENRKVTLLCVFVDQQSVVDKFPAESIRYNDNDSFRTSSRRGIRDVGGQAVEGYHLASRFCILSFRASEAIGTSHSVDQSAIT